ncbi:hypothetical protein [Kribbella sp. NBC_00889]|uniref:hypothetical protein n=1 Tax=Kribbella sp. NBC_00889 TaxID=2975974 RepID=UPI00386986BB|nr:hypothetical protein OG817_40550 [Kribbella sp. NBC_00889]
MTTAPAAPVPSSPAPVRRSWSAWRTVLVILGSLLILLGGGLLVGGGIGLWAHSQRDADGYHTAGPERITTDAYALTAPSLDVAIAGPDALYANDLLGDVRIRIESTNAETPLFVGIGPAGEVARYLDGVGHSEVSDIDVDPFKVSYVPHQGDAPAADPSAQTFWVASDSGTGPRTLDWDVADGNWSVVVMNADGSPGVDADVSVGGTLPIVLPIAIATLVVGGILLILGIVLVVVTVATRRTVRTPVQTAPGQVPAP